MNNAIAHRRQHINKCYWQNPLRMIVAVTMLGLLSGHLFASSSLQPRYQEVELQPFTSLELAILPDVGTQLIFPFLLDNPELQPGLKIRLTNSDDFEVPHDAQAIKTLLAGQNTLTIMANADPDHEGAIYRGTLFISLGGYHITMALKTTFDITEHTSNIIFTLTDEDRDYLVEQQAKHQTTLLEQQQHEAKQQMEALATQKSLAYIATMALHKPKKTYYREEQTIDMDGHRVVVYIDRLEDYGGKYAILVFDLENKSAVDFSALSIDVMSINDRTERAVMGAYDCSAPTLRADKTLHCGFATTDRTIDKATRLKLIVNTDRGQGSMVW